MDFDYIEDPPFEDPIFGEEATVDPSFSNGSLTDTLKSSKGKTSKSHASLKPPHAKPKVQVTNQAVQWQYASPRQLRPRPNQPRQTFDPDALAELAASIKSRGILQPILVREVAASSDAEATYEILAGERRVRASQAVGLTQVPILVLHLDDAAACEVALIENVQREDLTALETAGALTQMTQLGYSIRKLAEKVGKQKGWVEQHLMLTRLPEDLLGMVSGRPDAATHARDLEKVKDPQLRAKLIALVSDGGLSLVELRRRIRQEGGIVPKPRKPRENKSKENAPFKTEVLENTVTDEGAQDKGVEIDAAENEITASDLSNTDNPGSVLEEAGMIGKVQAEQATPVAGGSEAQCSQTVMETTGAASAETTLRQSAMKAKLRTLLRDLDKLDRPADPGILTEMTQLLQEAQEALTVTLELWAL